MALPLQERWFSLQDSSTSGLDFLWNSGLHDEKKSGAENALFHGLDVLCLFYHLHYLFRPYNDDSIEVGENVVAGTDKNPGTQDRNANMRAEFESRRERGRPFARDDPGGHVSRPDGKIELPDLCKVTNTTIDDRTDDVRFLREASEDFTPHCTGQARGVDDEDDVLVGTP